MNIVIVGAGFTGIQLAKRLIEEKNIVTILENDEDTVRHARNMLDCTVIQADGNNLNNLEDAGIQNADALVAVTENDEINMITCSLVDAVYPNVLKIARVRNYAYYVNTNEAAKHHAETFANNHRPLYGIDYMIHPDVEAAEAIVTAVEHGVSDVVPLGDGEYELTTVQIAPGSQMDGIVIKNIRTLTECKLIVVFVDKDKGGASLPAGDTVLHAGDSIGVLAHRDNMNTLLELCGSGKKNIKKVVMVGAGKIGTLVAERLVQQRQTTVLRKLFGSRKNQKRVTQDFVIVDKDNELCDAATEKFPDAKVFCADITDESFIAEEGLDKFNLAICVTHNHEMNMVVAAYFESIGVKNTIALITNSTFTDIAQRLGVDVTVPIRDTVVDSIMSHLRGKNVTDVHTLSSGEFEIVECDVPSTSKYLGKSLKNVARPGEFLMLLIKKPGSTGYQLPNGDTVFNVGDHLVLIEKIGDKKILENFSGKE
ncbi:MAG: NAD-binding protein [Treponema sp.]|nr:NAD-binding protein [Treponema sp.]